MVKPTFSVNADLVKTFKVGYLSFASFENLHSFAFIELMNCNKFTKFKLLLRKLSLSLFAEDI